MSIEKIIKRDGRIVPFNQDKITDAIYRAAKSVGGHDKKKAEYVSNLVVKELEKNNKGQIPQVEEIQDLVERVLIKQGHAKTAKAYILYRQSHKELRDIKGMFDTIDAVEEYLGEGNWMVRENANMGYSLQGMNNYITTILTTNYWLGRVYPEKIRKAHTNADIHIHDLGTLAAYCVGWDLEDLLTEGFKGVAGKVESKPPKHLRSALGQIVNFFYTLQGETAGAQAFSNFDTFLAPFVKADDLDYKEVKQCMQEFLFNLAVPTRVGFQTPFTNITLDLKVPGYLKDKPVVIGGEVKENTYSDYQLEMDMINRAFAECMIEGDARGRPFTFPIPTYNITKDFDWDNPNYEGIWEMTAKYGIPYFSNFINSDMKPEDARSMCCRLRLDQNELKKRGGGIFGSYPLTGSIGVVTINLPRISYTSKNEEAFFKRLEELIDISKDSLQIKRKSLEKFTDMGLYPYSKFYLRNVKERFGEYWKNHFSTIGILGMNEAIMNLIPGGNIATEKGKEFALRVLDFMVEKSGQYKKETGELYNIEAVPGEGTTYRFARIDKKKFNDIIVANEEAVKKGGNPFYTNSTHLPVNYTDNIFEALKLQDPLQIKYTGGTVFHTWVGEKLSGENVKLLVRKIAENFKLPYFTITPTFSICQEHGYLAGDHEFCPKCNSEGKRTEPERYSRIVGYIRPLKQWNEGKQAEWKERKMFNATIKINA